MNKSGVGEMGRIGVRREVLAAKMRTNVRQAYQLTKTVLRRQYDEGGKLSKDEIEKAIYHLQLAYQETKELGG